METHIKTEKKPRIVKNNSQFWIIRGITGGVIIPDFNLYYILENGSDKNSLVLV